VSRAHGIELRSPLVDDAVITAWSHTSEGDLFLPLGRKLLLRRAALSRLDPALFERPKAGFVLPLEKWCRSDLRDPVNDVLTDATLCTQCGLDPTVVARLWSAFLAGAPGLYWSRIWALFVYLSWCRAHDLRWSE
jgi:asparagine synthase (glutamine-hydrolysing)